MVKKTSTNSSENWVNYLLGRGQLKWKFHMLPASIFKWHENKYELRKMLMEIHILKDQTVKDSI